MTAKSVLVSATIKPIVPSNTYGKRGPYTTRERKNVGIAAFAVDVLVAGHAFLPTRRFVGALAVRLLSPLRRVSTTFSSYFGDLHSTIYFNKTRHYTGDAHLWSGAVGRMNFGHRHQSNALVYAKGSALQDKNVDSRRQP